MNYQDINAQTIGRWVDEGWEWGIPIDHETYENACKGNWDVFLTPTVPVPKDWLGDLKGKKLLGLASGGGQQMPIFTAAGAQCTILDYCDQQLSSEKMVSEREGYEINIVKADMTKPLPFDDDSFDIIFHPVSNDYVREVLPIFRECFRILKKGGVLFCGLSNGINFMVDEDERTIVFSQPFDPVANEDQRRFLEKDDSGMQFSHTIEEQIGGQLKAGFRLLDLYEDTNGYGYLEELKIKTFIATKSIKE